MRLKAIALFVVVASVSIQAAFAQDPVRVSHKILSINELGNTVQLQIELTISNYGDTDLKDLTLVPEGIEFSQLQSHKYAHVSYLPVNGSITKTWFTRSNLAPQYFAHETPLLFLIEAIDNNGEPVVSPVISGDGEVM